MAPSPYVEEGFSGIVHHIGRDGASRLGQSRIPLRSRADQSRNNPGNEQLEQHAQRVRVGARKPTTEMASTHLCGPLGASRGRQVVRRPVQPLRTTTSVVGVAPATLRLLRQLVVGHSPWPDAGRRDPAEVLARAELSGAINVEL